ncbi:hypothetical protein NF212_12675 [Parasalinivibrio latis]|uniref:hypothetical protein n=1 Tax=Parasalinivibrio latis TaxID=2952610 RepID=UPI0030E489ED
MKTNKTKLTVVALSLAVIAGCGGSDSEGGKSKGYTNEQVARAVKCTNQAEGDLCEQNSSGQAWGVYYATDSCFSGVYCFEDGHDVPEHPALTRYVEGQLIPVYFREKEDQRFTKTMDYIEGLVGYQMFDRKGVVDIDISNPNEINLDHLDSDWGLILSQGTSIGDAAGSGYCSQGTVSVAPYSFNMSSHIISVADYGIKYPAITSGRNHKFTWVNLDSIAGANNGQITCSASAPQDVATHEFAHALGMYNHFSGFGFDGAWDKNAERVLKTIYSRQNPQGQPFDSLFIEN